jgi:hypothetical protein
MDAVQGVDDMSISGDMVASIVSTTNLDHSTARLILMKALETANDPNFASRYASAWLDDNEIGGRTASVGGKRNNKAHNDKMLDYWDVIKFLQAHL